MIEINQIEQKLNIECDHITGILHLNDWSILVQHQWCFVTRYKTKMKYSPTRLN